MRPRTTPRACPRQQPPSSTRTAQRASGDSRNTRPGERPLLSGLGYQVVPRLADDDLVLTERFKERFDWFGLVVSVATLAFGLWDRLHGRSSQGDYLILLGLVVGTIATVSLVRRART